MLNLRKGSIVPLGNKLYEGYQRNGNVIFANVNTDKICKLMEEFMERHEELLFFVLELPSKKADETISQQGRVEKFHVDVYYIDGCNRQEAKAILDKVGDLLVNDGLCRFGFGGHVSHDEIMLGRYNVMTIYGAEHECFDGFFEKYGISAVEELVTAGDTFSPEFPGKSESITIDGKSVYDIPEIFQNMGMYFAERRQE